MRLACRSCGWRERLPEAVVAFWRSVRPSHAHAFLVQRLEDLERADEILVDGHHRSRVVEFSAVIRSGEYGDELSVAEELVAIFDDLVCSADEVEVVLSEEGLEDVRAEDERDASLVVRPLLDFFVRVGPEQVAQQAWVTRAYRCRGRRSA